jgi:serine/threonine-protein kinase
MTPARWRAVEAVLQAALDRSPAERAAYVAETCRGDPDLRREVESLLDAAPTTGFLEHPAWAATRSDVRPAPVPVADAGRDEIDGGAPTLARLSSALAGRYVGERELGRGGMATVYLARDLRHRRLVAVKVLHPELAAALGPERFLREIELTASLQHPHILPLFDSGAAEGLLYYVMPYVEGETLRARLAREGQLPVDAAVRLAREVADALAYAHGQGVVHRDLKPENVLLSHGHALVADFGIALAVEQAGGARMTRTGLSLGTPQYMAPEQAMGERTVDARADVFALGVVLYEMLAGEPPFTGPTAQAVVAKVVTEEPKALMALRRTVPPHVEAAVRRALEKLPADRLPSAAGFADALAAPAFEYGARAPGDGAPAALGRFRPVSPRVAAILVAGTLAVASVGVAVGWWTRGAAVASTSGVAARGPLRFTIEPDSGAPHFGSLAVSPDGRTVVYAGYGPSGARLYARPLDDPVVRPLPGTEDGDLPFFSPDGGWVGFYSHGALRKLPLEGGAPVVVTAVPGSGRFGSGSWGADDVILFVGPAGRLYRVPADGGAASRVEVQDTTLYLLHPHLLPGGRAALVTATRDYTAGRVGVLDLASGRVRQFGAGAGARYVAGTIVFVGRGGELYRQRFDLQRLEPTGPAEQIASGLDAATVTLSTPTSALDASPAGALVYRAGAAPSDAGTLRLILVDRLGRELRAVPARVPWAPRLSPDGRRVAYGAFAPGRDSSDVWVTDLATNVTQRLTTDGLDNNDPQWSPDGNAIVYSAFVGAQKDVFAQPLRGGSARRVTRAAGIEWPSGWTSDGRTLLVTRLQRTGERDVWVHPLDGGAARPYLATPAHEKGARASPDGHWVAYQSDESGRDEVYVRSFPDSGRKTLVSAGGGVNPMWRG